LTENVMDEYTESLTEDVCFYNNFLHMMKSNFVSPISSYGLMYYKYVICDTIFKNEEAYYQIDFWPRRKKDKAFYGFLQIHDETYGLKKIDARLSTSANLNYIQDIKIFEEYFLENDIWMPVKKDLSIEFKLFPANDTAKMLDSRKILAQKTNEFKNFTPGFNYNDYQADLKKNTSRSFVDKSSNNSDTVFWDENRFSELSASDVQKIEAIGAMNDLPAVRISDKLLNMIMYGYYDLGKFELGPWMLFYTSNAIEGSRVNLAAKTSPELMKNLMLSGYLGYGFKDRKFKYGTGFGYKIPSYKRQIFYGNYSEDVIYIGHYQQNLRYVRENQLIQTADALSAITQWQPPIEVYFVRNGGIKYEVEWKKGRINRLSGNYFRHHSPPFFPFYNNSREPVPYFDNYEITLNTRISFKEEVSDNFFRRVYLDTKKPIINIDLSYGNYSFEQQSGNYYKIRGVVDHTTNIALGELEYIFEAGKYFGAMPYLLLEIPRSDESFMLANYYFNRLRYMEYAADQFVSAIVYYNLNGLFLHSIPLVKELNFREVITFKGFYGNLNYRHNDIIDFPSGLLNEMTVPYMELGLGISNILKVGRIEYVWRLTETRKPGVRPHGLHFRFQLEL
jgi:hypothetical protein